MTDRTWTIELAKSEAYSGHHGLTLRCGTSSETHAREVALMALSSPESHRDSLESVVLAKLESVEDWQRFRLSREQLCTAKRALELAVARQEEAASALKTLRLQPETKGWASRLQAAEQVLAERGAEVQTQRATVATLTRAVEIAREPVEQTVQDTVNQTWLEVARKRESAYADALAAVGAALAGVLPALVIAEANRRPLERPATMAGEILDGLEAPI